MSSDEAKGQVLAIGGLGTGTFDAWKRELRALSGSPRPRICYLSTPTGDAQADIDAFYRTFAEPAWDPSDFTLFRPPKSDLFAQDIIWVPGGSVVNTLAVWHANDLAEYLAGAWRNGALLAGVSAGASCWFEEAIALWRGQTMTSVEATKILPGSFSAHYGIPARRQGLIDHVAKSRSGFGWGVPDDVALHFTGANLARVVTARDQGVAYKVRATGDSVVEETLEATARAGADAD